MKVLATILALSLSALGQGATWGGGAKPGGGAKFGGSGAVLAPIVRNVANCGTGSVTNPTCTATYATAVAGEVLVDGEAWSTANSTSVGAPTGCSSTWTQVGTGYTDSTNGIEVAIYVGTVTSSGSCSVVLSGTSSGSSFIQHILYEWENASTTVDGGSGSGYNFNTVSCSSCTAPAVSPSVSNDAVMVFDTDWGFSGSVTVNSPFNADYSANACGGNTNPCFGASDVPAGTGSLAATFSSSNFSANQVAVVALKP
jgi:hypothetical protein